ncbi:GAF domain-containing sensor histidine kinase [Leptolyngbya sp. FACHB-36]|nr:GAF domain-containing sensor histidine kinase [Leptolyngbya sp. FACHB-36]
MMNSDSRLFCRLDGLSSIAREQQRMQVMTELGLLEPESVPVFEEATQTVAHSLNVPICILGLMEPEHQRFKSAVGLSRLGLMNELATVRQLPRLESFCTHVVDSQQILLLPNTLAHPAFANSYLAHQYGIRAYLSVPLMTSAGVCLGSLAVMDLVPHEFTQKDVEFLELTARWTMSEFERQQLVKVQQFSAPSSYSASPIPPRSSIATQLRIELLSQLTQELCTPLTSVMGMASVLNREIYGPLTTKQKEYLDIIHRSGQYLLSLVNEILQLSELKDNSQALNLTSVDVEMLCQQAINALEQAAYRREQQIRLSVEPGRRVWLLDKDKARQMLYHLIFSIVQSSNAGSTVRLHVSRKSNNLNIAVWVSHPWLGEGLPCGEVSHPLVATGGFDTLDGYPLEYETSTSRATVGSTATIATHIEPAPADATAENLGVLLCRQFAQLHGGHLMIQRGSDAGYRYIISLPRIAGVDDE